MFANGGWHFRPTNDETLSRKHWRSHLPLSALRNVYFFTCFGWLCGECHVYVDLEIARTKHCYSRPEDWIDGKIGIKAAVGG